MREIRLWSVVAVPVFTAIMVSITWEHLRGGPFSDYQQYVEHFLHGESIFKYHDLRGFLDYFLNEALWEYSVREMVHSVGIPIDTLFLAISALCVATFAIFLGQRHNAFSIVLLFNPLLVDFAFSQLRLALAYSLLLVAYLLRRPLVAAVLLIAALFIHTSIVIFVGAYFAIRKIIETANTNGQRNFATFALLCFMGIAVSIAIGPLRPVILGYIGDRRAALEDGSGSLLYSSFWVGLLGLFGLQPRSFLRNEVNAYSVFLLAIVAANLLTGGYTLRFLSVGIPMVLSAMLSMTSPTRGLTIALYLLYTGIQWVYWIHSTP